MEHCRFENTYLALSECYYAMLNGYNELSESEQKYAKLLKTRCEQFINDFNL